MPNYQTPGVYVEEVSTGARPIQAVGTSTAAFLGVAPDAGAHLQKAVAVNSWPQFKREYAAKDGVHSTPLSHAVHGFFLNGGRRCWVVNVGEKGNVTGGGSRGRRGVDLLEPIDEIAIVAAPGCADMASYEALLTHCESLRDRVCVLDAPMTVDDVEALTRVATTSAPSPDATRPPGLRARITDRGYGALYFPWIQVLDPLDSDQLVDVPPSGHVAGVWARTDALRGVHKAPANEPLQGALGLRYQLTSEEQGVLNPQGVNCIRYFPQQGIRIWGARTLADGASEWRYLNVRRLFNMIEKSIARSTNWVVFEPNDPNLWASITRDITMFLTSVWRDGALMGATPQQAFFVQCDAETNTPDVIDAGRVVTRIGIAPVKPAEFIVFLIGQYAGGAEVTEEKPAKKEA